MKTVIKHVLLVGRGRSKRGFSLIEVAIALAVVGLLLGGLLMPVGEELRRKAYIKTHAQVADAIDAIVGYAATTRSQGMLIGYSNGYDIGGNESVRGHFGAQFTYVPAGRPYLPCPDIDNDGLEDRYGTDSSRSRGFLETPATLNPDTLSVLDYYRGTATDNLLPTYFEISRLNDSDIELPVFGECKLHFGNLPWKTLLLPAADAWGSMFTYVVNPNFSTSGFGFDQHTRASVFPLYSRPDLEITTGSVVQMAGMIGHFERARTPILVCDFYAESSHLQDNPAHQYGPCSSARTRRSDTSLDPTNFRGTHAIRGNRIQNLVGDVLGHTSVYPLARANHVTHVMPVHNVITDGVAFAVISHGADRGGSRSVANGDCIDLAEDNRNIARLGGPGVHAQKQNALYSSCADELELQTGGVGGRRIEDPRGFLRRLPDIGHQNNYSFDKDFSNIGDYLQGDMLVSSGVEDAHTKQPADIFGSIVALGRGGEVPPGQRKVPSFGVSPRDAEQRFDDVVGWLTRRELADRLYDAGIFPVAYYPGFLAEGMPADLSGL